MGLHSNVYIGHVETINPNVFEKEKFLESKVVALQLVGFDNNKRIPTYKPLRRYGEYYKLISVEPILGIVSDSKINRRIKSTGKKEVKVLKKVS